MSDFYHRKFTNQELYEWMISRLSDLHYQTYQLALDMARAAERSFQFERGNPVRDELHPGAAVGQPAQRAAARLHSRAGADRMQAAFITTDARRFEITKAISLLKSTPWPS